MRPNIQKVCNFYLGGMSMRQALVAAGYSESYADHHSLKFLKNKEVMTYIRARQKDEADAALADAIYTRTRLMDIVADKTATNREKIEALRALDAHNKWMSELDARLKELENSKKVTENNASVININLNEYKENTDIDAN